ncbi:MFS transporter [Bacillus sp. DX4.1]|uniref:MDR family MFS transporter n=1 Tax=Bacillus sp. DX4.1 TaxID=3055867 RepID=UPI0025A012C4|nr:MFS transporter [Bacillus sp. DX4.1]MDM5185982.1 MFS transporter [Bacillus sp. DX4.1]
MKEKDGILIFKEFHTNIKIRLVCSFFNRLATRAILPFMALYFSEELGKLITGMLMTINIILQFASSLVGGYLADKFPRKKVLLIGQLSNSICYLGMAIFIYPKFNVAWGVLLFFMLSACVGSLHKSAMDAIIVDSTDEQNRKKVLTYDYWLVNLAFALGMIMGGFFYKNYKFELFSILTIFLFVTTYVYQKYITENKNHNLEELGQSRGIKGLFHNYVLAIKDKRWLLFVCGGIFIYSAEFSMGNYIGVRLAEEFIPIEVWKFQLDGIKMLSLLQVENTLLVVTLTFVVSNFTKRCNEKIIFMVGLLMNILGYGVVAYSNQWVILIVFIFIATIGELIYSPIRQVKQVDLIPKNKRASYFALGSFSIQGASIIASIGITMGAFLQSELMSVVIVFLGILGIILTYSAVYLNKIKNYPKKKSV